MQDPPGSTPHGSVRDHDPNRLDAPIDALIRDLTARVQSGEQGDSTVTQRLLGVLGAEIGVRSTIFDRYAPQAAVLGLTSLMAHPDITSQDLSELRGATCLDFGCGGLNPVGGMFAMLLAGAAVGIAVDPDEVQSIPCAVRALYHLLCAAVTGSLQPRIPGTPTEILARVSSFDIPRLSRGDGAGVDLQRLRFVQGLLRDARLADGSIDVLVSNSVMEHVEDVDGVLAEMARIVRPGGLMVHAIDGFDHRHYGAPARFAPHAFLLDHADSTMLHGCNRIRPLEFASRFERAGFCVRGVSETLRLPIPDADLEQLAPRFRALPRDHLEVARAVLYLRRE